jgi:hypothetical protein
MPEDYATIATLAPDEARNFGLAMSLYADETKEYNRQQEAIKELKEWIRNHIAYTYLQTCCLPSESLATWHEKLCEEFRATTAESKYTAREAYREATKPLARSPKDWLAWIALWETAMSSAVYASVAQALDPVSWFADFIRAVIKPAETWAQNYQIVRRDQVEAGQISYREVANAFRRDFVANQQQRQPSIVEKGTFAAHYAGQAETTEQSNKGNASSGHKRSRKSTNAAAHCPICSGQHALSRCYYAFPEKAPSWWKPSEATRDDWEANLQKDQIKQEIAKIKGKRARPNDATAASPATERED